MGMPPVGAAHRGNEMAWEREATSLPAGIPRVAICIPHTGSVTLEWVETTYGPLRFVPVSWCVKNIFLGRGKPLATQREMLVEGALNWGCTHVLFIDSDNVVETPADPNEALRLLLECNAPIVSGLYRAKKPEGFMYCMWNEHPTENLMHVIESWTGNWIQPDLIGIGFCLIRREVFEKVPKPWFKWDKPTPSEDFYFIKKARQEGYVVNVFTDVRSSHIGTLAVTTDGEIRTLRA